jgi:AraC family L-rhamnose operon transcriptional activator RhaR
VRSVKGSEVFDARSEAIQVQRIESHLLCPPHEHDFIEIVLTVNGTARQQTAQRCVPVGRGTLTVLRPGHWHSYLECRKLTIYNCCFGPELLRFELAWLINNPTLTWLLWGTGEAVGRSGPPIFHLPPPVVRQMQEILDHFKVIRHSSYDVRISWLGFFLATLAENLRGHVRRDEKGKLHFAVIRSIRLIESDLARAWTVGDLATECGCSREYLVRLFKTTMGLPPHAYINRCRAERAASLLLRSPMSIKEIGAQVGWPEPCHFARRFKREFGVAATLYRDQRQGSAQLAAYSNVLPKTALSPSSSPIRSG